MKAVTYTLEWQDPGPPGNLHGRQLGAAAHNWRPLMIDLAERPGVWARVDGIPDPRLLKERWPVEVTCRGPFGYQTVFMRWTAAVSFDVWLVAQAVAS